MKLGPRTSGVFCVHYKELSQWHACHMMEKSKKSDGRLVNILAILVNSDTNCNIPNAGKYLQWVFNVVDQEAVMIAPVSRCIYVLIGLLFVTCHMIGLQ
jgi:hypothetical protein